MSYYNHRSGHLSISGGDARSVISNCVDGTITIKEKTRTEVIQMVNGQVLSYKIMKNGKYNYWIEYGAFEKKVTENGREILSFRKGSNRGKHGRAVKYCSLFGSEGRCVSRYSRGRLIEQVFTYKNRVTAYKYLTNSKSCLIVDNKKKPLWLIEADRMNVMSPDASSVFSCLNVKEFNAVDIIRSKTFKIIKYEKGKVVNYGTFVNRQKHGEWKLNTGEVVNYEHGMIIPKIFLGDPDKIDPKMVLNHDNAQLRASLISKIGITKIVEKSNGKVVHKEKDAAGNIMELISIPMAPAKDIQERFGNAHFYDKRDAKWGQKADTEMKILKVICPTTKSTYYLPVDPRATKCEQARQWTFGVPLTAKKSEWIKFAKET